MARKLSTLDFLFRQRPFVNLPGGTTKAERNFLDFIVDGQSLVDQTRYDLVSVLCKEWPIGEREKSVRRLLREESADFPDDRRSLLVCGECGDIGCGAVSISLQLSGKTVVWESFGYENNYEPAVHRELVENLGPFAFDIDDYRKKLIHALEILKAPL